MEDPGRRHLSVEPRIQSRPLEGQRVLYEPQCMFRLMTADLFREPACAKEWRGASRFPERLFPVVFLRAQNLNSWPRDPLSGLRYVIGAIFLAFWVLACFQTYPQPSELLVAELWGPEGKTLGSGSS